MKPQSRKAKGRELQKHIAKIITEVFNLKEGDVESRSMGSGGVDCLMSPKAREHCPISIEAKNTKTFPSLAALEQSTHNCYKGTIPAVVWKPPGKGYSKSIIYFNLEEFMKWLKEIKCQNQK